MVAVEATKHKPLNSAGMVLATGNVVPGLQEIVDASLAELEAENRVRRVVDALGPTDRFELVWHGGDANTRPVRPST